MHYVLNMLNQLQAYNIPFGVNPMNQDLQINLSHLQLKEMKAR